MINQIYTNFLCTYRDANSSPFGNNRPFESKICYLSRSDERFVLHGTIVLLQSIIFVICLINLNTEIKLCNNNYHYYYNVNIIIVW